MRHQGDRAVRTVDGRLAGLQAAIDVRSAAAADDFALQLYLHLHALNRGILMAPFHSMALTSPATTSDDAARHTNAFREAVASLFAWSFTSSGSLILEPETAESGKHDGRQAPPKGG